jgi:hypothetical protein
MGIHLITAAITWGYPQLGTGNTADAAKVALTVICSHAIDTHDPPWYGQGWQPIAAALGCDGLTTTAAKMRVSRALTPLVDNKLIERTYLTPTGRRISRSQNACWLIHINP